LGGLIELEFEHFITPQNLLESLKRGKEQVYGEKEVWETHEIDKDKAKKFTLGMQSISIRPAIALANTFDMRNYNCFLDIGAGSGVFCVHLLLKNPNLCAIAFDIAPVCEVAQEFFNKNNLSDRGIAVPGDFFHDPSFPNEHPLKKIPVDVIFFSQILHDWPVDKGINLLKKAFQGLPSGGIVIIHEKLLENDRSGPPSTTMVSIDMLFWTEGQQFTPEKLISMMKEVGFIDFQVQKTVGYWSYVWAKKP